MMASGLRMRIGKRTFAISMVLVALSASALVMAAILMPLASSPAWADSVAEFDYGTADFNFWYEGQEYQTDIFDNLKGVMPGDVRHECIEIRNAATSQHDVRIYFTVKAIGQDDYAFFSLMDLKLEQEGVTEPLYEGNCAAQALMPDGIYLGTFAPGESTHFDLTLTASPEMDDVYQGASGTSYGAFTAEVIGVDDSVPQSADGGTSGLTSGIAKMGDAAGLVAIVAAVAIFAAIAMLVRRKRRE